MKVKRISIDGVEYRSKHYAAKMFVCDVCGFYDTFSRADTMNWRPARKLEEVDVDNALLQLVRAGVLSKKGRGQYRWFNAN